MNLFFYERQFFQGFFVNLFTAVVVSTSIPWISCVFVQYDWWWWWYCRLGLSMLTILSLIQTNAKIFQDSSTQNVSTYCLEFSENWYWQGIEIVRYHLLINSHTHSKKHRHAELIRQAPACQKEESSVLSIKYIRYEKEKREKKKEAFLPGYSKNDDGPGRACQYK